MKIKKICKKIYECIEIIGYRINDRYEDFIHFFVHWYWHITKGFCYCETWSLDTYIAVKTLPRLKYLREHLHGCPASIMDDVKSTPETDKKNMEDWKKTLDEIIFAMQYIVDERDGDTWKKYGIVSPDFHWITSDSPSASFEERYMGKESHPIDWDKLKKIEERVQGGLILFGKHFSSFWD